jgi:hypothetical protein
MAAQVLASRAALLEDRSVNLPPDLLARGYKLIVRAPDRMFAVSTLWGCTSTKDNLPAVIREARSLIGFCQWMNKKGLR